MPAASEQHRLISERIEGLRDTEPAGAGAGAPAPSPPAGSWWKQGLGVAVTLGVLLITKAKFILLGLAKYRTFVSMVGFFGVYWSLSDGRWRSASSISIYIHEMGHVSDLRRLGIHAGAPLFIPGVGAVVLLKQRIDDPVVDARIGLAGPIWGLLAAGAVAWGVYFATGTEIWKAIGELDGLHQPVQPYSDLAAGRFAGLPRHDAHRTGGSRSPRSA